MSGPGYEDDARAVADWRLFLRLWPYITPHLPAYLAAFMLAPVSALLSVSQPWLLKIALDDYILVADAAGARTVALVFLGAVALGWLAESGYMYLLSVGAAGTITDLRDAVYRHTLRLAPSFFDRQPKGRLLTRVTSDVEALGETLTAGAVTIVLDVLVVLGVLLAMFSLDFWLTLVMLALSPVLFVVVEVLRRILRALYVEVRTSLSELNAFTTERINGLEVVQLYGDEERAIRQFDHRLGRYRGATIRTNIYDAALYAIIDGLSAITVALLLWYGTGFSADALTPGLLAAFLDYVNRLYVPIQEFSAKLAVFQRATTSMEKIFGLLEVQEMIPEGSVLLPQARGSIILRDVTFGYGERPVLKKVNLEVHPGEVIALVGRTGSGKTTIGRLLTRAYHGYQGSITLDGHELVDLRLSEVRRAVGVVLQDVQLFPGDVRFNLTLGAEVADERLLEAIRLARADEVVARLGGLDGKVEHKGANLSAGEGQLLSMARALVYDPPVVILDEATASVDTLTERKIQAATDEVLRTKTVVVIAHRLSTIVNAARIYVLDQGRVVESGNHASLLAQDGRYAELYRRQFSGPDQPEDGTGLNLPGPGAE
jgi:ATP-binding cassette subfamily B protein